MYSPIIVVDNTSSALVVEILYTPVSNKRYSLLVMICVAIVVTSSEKKREFSDDKYLQKILFSFEDVDSVRKVVVNPSISAPVIVEKRLD
jgi:hypothetical protein